jgi:hypothetical protein
VADPDVLNVEVPRSGSVEQGLFLNTQRIIEFALSVGELSFEISHPHDPSPEEFWEDHARGVMEAGGYMSRDFLRLITKRSSEEEESDLDQPTA